jgi:hypothetical protein
MLKTVGGVAGRLTAYRKGSDSKLPVVLKLGTQLCIPITAQNTSCRQNQSTDVFCNLYAKADSDFTKSTLGLLERFCKIVRLPFGSGSI